MLLVLYGIVSEMGHKSRQYLVDAGFDFIEKYNYAPGTPDIHVQFGTRNYVSKETFYENTDSLFRYEVGGILVGFNQQQISDAVCNKTNALLTLSTHNIDFLGEIKQVYGSSVCTVYAYIDEATLQKLLAQRDLGPQELQARLQIGADVRQCYRQNPGFFDHIVVYGGEDSTLDMESLYAQYDAILQKLNLHAEEPKYSEVYLSYSHKDRHLCQIIASELACTGIRVFWEDSMPPGKDFQKVLMDRISHARCIVPILTPNALESSWVKQEISYAMHTARDTGTVIYPLVTRDVQMPLQMQMLLGHIQWEIADAADMHLAAKRLAERITHTFAQEAQLQALTKRVDNYRKLKMNSQAAQLQREHLQLCQQMHLDRTPCLLSRIKLADLLLNMQQNQEALQLMLDAGQDIRHEQLFAAAAEPIGRGLAQLGYTADQAEIYIRTHLEEATKDVLQAYEKARQRIEQEAASRRRQQDENREENRIAHYSELVMDMFEGLLRSENENRNPNDLILGYKRILNYCEHMGIQGEAVEKCIDRIAVLEQTADTSPAGKDTDCSKALKLYLGQTLPESGEYDIFLSYKSEDEAIARKVYNYLTRCGKAVFFSRESLLKLGETEYGDMIAQALDHSKHMAVVTSNPEYLKTKWVKKEWGFFDQEITEGRKDGKLVLVMTDDVAGSKDKMPPWLRMYEVIKMSELESRLLSYLG